MEPNEHETSSDRRVDRHPSGFVYVFSNPSIPGYVKIGQTADNPFIRAKELFTTGIPEPFIVERAFFVRDRKQAEAEIHLQLSRFRVSQNDREFFKISTNDAIIYIIGIIEKYIDFTIHAQPHEQEQQYFQQKISQLGRQISLRDEQIQILNARIADIEKYADAPRKIKLLENDLASVRVQRDLLLHQKHMQEKVVRIIDWCEANPTEKVSVLRDMLRNAQP